MTARGVGLLVVGVALFFLGDVTSAGWLYLADALLWAMLAFSAVVPLLSTGRLDVSQRLEVPRPRHRVGPTEGDELLLTVQVRNRRPWPSLGLTVNSDLSVNGTLERALKVFIPYVGPRSTVAVTGGFVSPRRGLYVAGGLTVASDAPLGLFRRRKRLPTEASVLVYPAPHPLEAERARTATAGVAAESVPARHSSEVSGSRGYMAGDTARDIHWRNSARTGRLMTKSFSAPRADTPVMVLGGAPHDPVLLDGVARVAAGAGKELCREHRLVRLQKGPVAHELEWADLLRELALLDTSPRPPLDDTLRAVDSISAVAVVVPASDREGIEALTRAAHRFPSLWVLLVTGAADGADPSPAAGSLEDVGAVVTLVPGNAASPDSLSAAAIRGVAS